MERERIVLPFFILQRSSCGDGRLGRPAERSEVLHVMRC